MAWMPMAAMVPSTVEMAAARGDGDGDIQRVHDGGALEQVAVQRKEKPSTGRG